MKTCSPEVAVILDGEFGDRIKPLSAAGVVWIAGSATNRAAVERLRRGETPYLISVFDYDPETSGAEALAEILPVLDSTTVQIVEVLRFPSGGKERAVVKVVRRGSEWRVVHAP